MTRLAPNRPVVLAFVFAALLAVPSIASAQAPDNDNYLGSTAINSDGSPLPTVNTRTGTIVNATVLAAGFAIALVAGKATAGDDGGGGASEVNVVDASHKSMQAPKLAGTGAIPDLREPPAPAVSTSTGSSTGSTSSSTSSSAPATSTPTTQSTGGGGGSPQVQVRPPG